MSSRINIAVAVPGDVTAERDGVMKVCTRWNDANEIAFLHPIMWESASVPALGDHPQHLLNPRITKGDSSVAVFWSRLQEHRLLPTDPGTVEEIHEFIRCKGPGRVMLYFCTKDLPYNIDPGELARLRQFKTEMQSQGLYHEYLTPDQFERDLYRHLDIKVLEHLKGKLPIPVCASVDCSDDGEGLQHADPRLRQLIDFGTALNEIATGFNKQMDAFDAIDGGGPDKYLNLGAHVYFSVATCLDRYLAFSAAGMSGQNKSVLEKISTRLKLLAGSAAKYTSQFHQFWKDGREICDSLLAHVQFLSHLSRQ